MKKKIKIKKDKKVFILIALVIIFIVALICFFVFGKHKMTCTMESNQSRNGYVLNTTYTIIYQRGIVKKVKINEIVQGDTDTILDNFKTSWTDNYEYLNKTFGGYTYKIKQKNKKVISNIIVDYEKINMKKYLRINEAMKEFVNDKQQVTVKGIKKMYENSGAVCK